MAAKPSKPRPSRTIPASLERAVLARLAELDPATGRPFTARDVAAWLGKTHGVTCSRMAVLRLRERADAKAEGLVVAALREELRDAVAPAVARLKRASKRLDALVAGEKNTQKVAAGVRALTSALDSLAKLGGVAAPVAVDVSSGGQPLGDARAALAACVARLAKERDAERARPAGRDDPPGGG